MKGLDLTALVGETDCPDSERIRTASRQRPIGYKRLASPLQWNLTYAQNRPDHAVRDQIPVLCSASVAG